MAANPVIPRQREYVCVRVSIRETLENALELAELLPKYLSPVRPAFSPDNFPSVEEKKQKSKTRPAEEQPFTDTTTLSSVSISPNKSLSTSHPSKTLFEILRGIPNISPTKSSPLAHKHIIADDIDAEVKMREKMPEMVLDETSRRHRNQHPTRLSLGAFLSPVKDKPQDKSSPSPSRTAPKRTLQSPRSPSEEAYNRILMSAEPKREVEMSLTTPKSVGQLFFRSRPCLVREVRHLQNKVRCIFAPVTKWNNEELENLTMTNDKKAMFLPMYPYSWDIKGREPIHTTPVWTEDHAYQMLLQLPCSISRLELGFHVTHTVNEVDFVRLLREMGTLRSSLTSRSAGVPPRVSSAQTPPSATSNFPPAMNYNPQTSSQPLPRIQSRTTSLQAHPTTHGKTAVQPPAQIPLPPTSSIHKGAEGVQVEQGPARGYIKRVHRTVTKNALYAALVKFGDMTDLDINRQKCCGFVEFSTHAALHAAIATGPIDVADNKKVIVEERKKSTKVVDGRTEKGSRRNRRTAIIAEDSRPPVAENVLQYGDASPNSNHFPLHLYTPEPYSEIVYPQLNPLDQTAVQYAYSAAPRTFYFPHQPPTNVPPLSTYYYDPSQVTYGVPGTTQSIYSGNSIDQGFNFAWPTIGGTDVAPYENGMFRNPDGARIMNSSWTINPNEQAVGGDIGGDIVGGLTEQLDGLQKEVFVEITDQDEEEEDDGDLAVDFRLVDAIVDMVIDNARTGGKWGKRIIDRLPRTV